MDTEKDSVRSIRRNHLITSCIQSKMITTNSTNPFFILAMVWTCFFSPFEKIKSIMKKLSYKYYKKQIATPDNGSFQFHDQEESKLNSTISANSGANTLTHEKVHSKNNNVATITTNKILANTLLLGPVE